MFIGFNVVLFIFFNRILIMKFQCNKKHIYRVLLSLKLRIGFFAKSRTCFK